MDADLQQRAVEYKGLEKRVDVALRNVQAMPPWLKRRSLLLRRMAEKEVRFSVLPAICVSFNHLFPRLSLIWSSAFGRTWMSF